MSSISKTTKNRLDLGPQPKMKHECDIRHNAASSYGLFAAQATHYHNANHTVLFLWDRRGDKNLEKSWRQNIWRKAFQR